VYYRPIQPAELPAERDAIVRWLATLAPAIWAPMIELGPSAMWWIPPRLRDLAPDAVAMALAAAERRRLRRATLFYATAEATVFAKVLGERLPRPVLSREILPADHGLLVFAEPIGIADSSATRSGLAEVTPVAGVAWGTIDEAGAKGDGPGVWLSYYTDVSAMIAELLIGQPTEVALEMTAVLGALTPSGRLHYEREQTYLFHPDAAWGSDLIGSGAEMDAPIDQIIAAEQLARTVIATWLLMREPGGLASRTLGQIDPTVPGDARGVVVIEPDSDAASQEADGR
jgi:hypothetical protein